jgi:hypothetical protein
MRGVAVRLDAPDGEHAHDLLMTNFDPPPAANAAEFMAMARAVAGLSSDAAKFASLVLRLPWQVGIRATVRIVRNLKASGRAVDSLATESYWSRGAVMWHDAGPVRYVLRPVAPAAPAPAGARPRDDDALRVDLRERLATGSVEFELAVQRYVSEDVTPVEDVSKPWPVAEVPVGRLVVPQQDLDTDAARSAQGRVDGLAFNPWNTPEAFRPLGNLNRARRAVYEASVAHRAGHRFAAKAGPVRAVVDAVADVAFGLLGRRVPWYRLPTRLSLFNLAVLRGRMRRENLIDGDPRPRRVDVRHPLPPPTDAELLQRDPAGRNNDLSAPEMGAIGSTFGRNMPVDRNQSDQPHPRDVSDLLLARDGRFIAAPGLNVLAAAWIQFQVHDWVNHRRYEVDERSVDLPPRPGRDDDVMRVGADRGSRNAVTHWWDGSEVYGTPGSAAPQVPDSADLQLDEHGCLPLEPGGLPRTDFGESWWLGLSVLQTVMTREHNAVCTALREKYRTMPEDRIFHVARLVVSALIAKIHAVEWTPAILGTEAIERGMNLMWNGTAGSLPEHHGVPFALTEEFVTVYRMHQLIPDDFTIVEQATGEARGFSLREIVGGDGEQVLRKYGLSDVVQSFATANAGAVTLHNFPDHLREFPVKGGKPIDLAAVDILRTRLRGVPRYNDFRAHLNMPRLQHFEQLTTDSRSLARIEQLYGSVDEIDTVVGLLAEKPPPGFGFSDTAFRIFLLMASRRLQSDRFLTKDFRPAVYTPLGMDWIADNSFRDVLARHCPELEAVLPRGKAVFAPWS